MTSCESCTSKDKQIRVLAADNKFQIKKMIEDQAEKIVTLQLHFHKEIKKLQDKLNKEKKDRDDQNKAWLEKYDRTIAECQATKQKTISNCEIELKNREGQLKQEYEKLKATIGVQFQGKITTLQKEKTQLKNSSEKEKKEMQIIFEQSLQELKKEEEQKIETICIKTETEKSNLVGLINDDREIHRKTIIDLQNKIEEVESKIVKRDGEIQYLKKTVSYYEREIQEKDEEIKSKIFEVEVLKEAYQERIEKLNKESEKKKAEVQKEMNKRLEGLLMKELSSCEKYEEVVSNIEEKRHQEMKIFQEQMEEVKVLVETRPSKEEDLDQINALKMLLSIKERDHQEALRVAKMCRLELDNKEETFNRMFSPYSPMPISLETIAKKDSKVKRVGNSVTSIKDINKFSATSIGYHSSQPTTPLFQVKKEKIVPRTYKFL